MEMPSVQTIGLIVVALILAGWVWGRFRDSPGHGMKIVAGLAIAGGLAVWTLGAESGALGAAMFGGRLDLVTR